MSAGKGYSKVFSPRRISRSLVTALALTLIQIVGGPVLLPTNTTPQASAANSALIQTGLTLNANATAGANDVASSMTLVGSPAHTNSGVGYYTFDANSGKYAYANRNFADSAPVSIFVWVYPTTTGVVMNHSGQEDPYTGYRLTMMDYTPEGKFQVGLFTSAGAKYLTSSTFITPLNNWYYVGLTYDGATTTLKGYINGQEFGSRADVSWLTATNDYFGVGPLQGGTCFGACSTPAAQFRFGELSIYTSGQSAANVMSNYLATQSRFAPATTNPTSTSITTNRSATYSASCSAATSNNGGTTCAYQWERSTDNGSNWSEISGATTSAYTTPRFDSIVTGYQYRVRVYDPGSGSPTAQKLYKNSAAATLTVTAQPVSESDTALNLNGTSQYAVASGSTILPTAASSPFTVEAWVYPTALGADSNIFSQGTDSTRFYYKRANGNLIFSRDGSGLGGEQNCGAFPSNQWSHVAVSWNGSNTFTCFINGRTTLIKTVSSPTTTLNGTAAIGQYSGGLSAANGFFPGQIDEVKIWSTARSEANIATGMNTRVALDAANLIAYYDFNEGTGSIVYNRVSNASTTSDFSYVGSPTLDTTKIESTTVYGPYTEKTFLRTYITASGGWKVPSGVSKATVLVVAGGGGGGSRHGGGGGAGGLGLGRNYPVTPSGIYTINVGLGGPGYGRAGNNAYLDASGNYVDYKPTPGGGIGASGTNSFFKLFTSSTESITALGGGGGSGSGAAGAGGSGGGSNQSVVGGTTTQYSGTNWIGYGYSGGQGSSGSCSTDWCGGGGGGADGVGQNGNSAGNGRAGNGGAGLGLPFPSGSTTYFAGGGGGASRNANASGGQGGIGGGGNGGTAAAGSSATTATGGGGGGGGFTATYDYAGGNGGSGIIIIRYITATKPTFTAPTNAYLNVGQTETFTTNVAADSATAMLTRIFRWESTTGGSGGTYSLLKTGTGAANASFSWVPIDTSTSGNQFLYRVIVTDSDSYGLSIQETSTAVFAVINGTLTFTGNSTINKTVGRSKSETFTVLSGTPTYRFTVSPTLSSSTLDTSTAGIAVLRLSDTMTVGTYSVTLTVTDSVSAIVSIPLTIKVSTPPSFSGGELVDTGTVLFLDMGNSNTYSGSGTSLGDLSGQGLSTSLVANLTGRLEGASTTTCSAPTYSTDHYGILNFASPQCGYVSNLGLLRSYTVETWVKRSGNQSGDRAILATPYAGSGKQINIALTWTGTNTVAAAIYSGGAWYSTAAATIADNTWVRLTATFNEATNVLSLFVDSETVTTRIVNVTVTWDLAKLDTGLLLGRKWGNDIYFNGSMGYLRIYNRVLSGAELLQNYNATKARFLTGQLATTHTSKYGTAVTDTFTVTSGSPSYTYSYVDIATNRVNSVPGFTYNVSNPSAPTLTVIPQLRPDTYYDTLTVTDSNGAVTRLSIKAIIAKADTLTIGFDTPTVVTYNGSQPSSYPQLLIRGLKNSDSVTVPTRFSSSRYALTGTVPVNADTYTVSAAAPTFTAGLPTFYEAVVYETSTLTILQARQKPLNVSLYGAVVGSPFTITLLGGSDTGTVTESVTAGSTAIGCAISNHVLTMTSTSISYCNLLVTKAGTQNYFAESATVSVYFLIYAINQPSQPAGTGSTIAVGGSTSVTVINTAPPAITSLSTYTAATGTSIDINGSGFTAAGLEVKFWRNKIPVTMTVVSDSRITATIPTGTTSGRIIITTANGSVASDQSLQITP